MDKIYKFGGRQHPFSNFYPVPCTYEGITYANGESAFQSAKTLDMDERRTFTNMDPAKAKSKGRRVELRSDWEQVKYNVMLDILRSKFQDINLRQQLLDTGDVLIVEDTTGRHDNEWGNCECPKCIHKEGRNLLGKAFMELRTELKGNPV